LFLLSVIYLAFTVNCMNVTYMGTTYKKAAGEKLTGTERLHAEVQNALQCGKVCTKEGGLCKGFFVTSTLDGGLYCTFMEDITGTEEDNSADYWIPCSNGLIPVRGQCQAVCAEGFTAVMGKCLQFNIEWVSYADANTTCASRNARLAILKDFEQESTYVEELKTAQISYWLYYWIGATYKDEAGKWVWSTGEILDWTNQEGSQGTGHCLEYNPGNDIIPISPKEPRYYALSCQQTKSYICEAF
ncbi:unnamed protein product, partial [Meganyctiphanes norvegica]